MLEYLMEKKKEIAFIVSVVFLAALFLQTKSDASDAKRDAAEVKQAITSIAKVAERLEDPNTWLRQYLLNHAVDSSLAKQYSSYQRGEYINKDGTMSYNIPFLSIEKLPEIGILKMRRADSTLIELDTLWDFTERYKE